MWRLLRALPDFCMIRSSGNAPQKRPDRGQDGWGFAPLAAVSRWGLNGIIGMMVNRGGSARRMRAYLGVAVGALALVLAAASARAGDNEPEKSLQDKLLEGIGIKSGPTIDYRE